MAEDIYRVVKGEKRKLSDKEIKSYIMEARGWDTKQYNKEYDKLRNRVKNYEAFKRASGVEPKKIQSARDILYYETRAMQRYGKDYEPSLEKQIIKSFPAYSTSKFRGGVYMRGKQKGEKIKGVLQDSKQLEKLQARFREKTLKQFEDFIAAHPKAQEITQKIEDPVKMEQALSDLAEALKVDLKAFKKAQKKSAIPFGDTFGYTDYGSSFDIEKYL